MKTFIDGNSAIWICKCLCDNPELLNLKNENL